MPKSMQKSYKNKSGSKYARNSKDPNRFGLNRSLTRRRAEIKELVSGVVGAIPANGFTYCLNEIGSGTDVNQRVGRTCSPRGIQVTWIAQGPGLSIAADHIRMAFVWDQQPNGATAAYNVIYETGITTGLLAFKNTKTQSDRFTIIKDMIIPVQNQSAAVSSGADAQTAGKFYVSLKSFPESSYAGTATGVPQTGALILVLYSNLNTGSGNTSGQMNIGVKFTYTDI